MRRLIVNADDFGSSSSVNQAVIRAHREGILTSASLMVNEPGCAEAVALAKESPKLGVGLHLTLVCGHSALPPDKIPGLVNERSEFGDNPVTVGCRYFFRYSLRDQLRMEIHAQFAKFQATGLPLDHVNSHLHFHMHPTVFRILMMNATQLGIRHLRLTREPFCIDWPLAKGRRLTRASYAVVFSTLSCLLRRDLRSRNIRHTRRVFGLLENDQVDEAYISKLLAALPSGDSELYSHPSLDDFKHQFDALVSPRVKALMEEHSIRLIRHQDL